MPGPIVEAFSLSHAEILDGMTAFAAAALLTADEAFDIYGVNEASLDPDTDEFENEGDDVVLSTWSWLNYAEVEVQAGYVSFPLIGTLTDQVPVVSGGAAAVNEVQTVTVTATGGTFTLTFDGATTAAIAYNATTGAVQSALLLLATLDDTDVVVTGSAGAYTVTFGGKYAGKPVDDFVANGSALTGPAAAVVVATATPGVYAAPAVTSLDLWHEDSMNVAPKPMMIVMPSKTADGVVRRLIIGLYKVQFSPITFDGPEYKEGLKINYNGRALMSAKDELGVTFPDGKKKVGRLLSIV